MSIDNLTIGELKQLGFLFGGKTPDNSYVYFPRAVARLDADDAVGAAEDAATAVKLAPAYAYYVLWLHVARARAGQNDAEELAANAKRIAQSKWPWPLVALFLGSAKSDEARQAAQSAVQSQARAEQVCVADYFIGVDQIDNGALVDARSSLQSAADHCPRDFVQRAAAEFELKRSGELTGASVK